MGTIKGKGGNFHMEHIAGLTFHFILPTAN